MNYDVDIWNSRPPASDSSRGLYISISGNTGAGKSTLVSLLSQNLVEHGLSVVAVNERLLHHPLVPLMFSNPSRYALAVQLNFLVQRHLAISRSLERGLVTVIERSHLDDPLFVETHVTEGNISESELSSFRVMHQLLSLRLPEPNIYVFLDASAELSLSRLETAESTGERPAEFPSNIEKERFVRSWALRFKQHYKNLLELRSSGKQLQNTELLSWPAETPTGEIVQSLSTFLRSVVANAPIR